MHIFGETREVNDKSLKAVSETNKVWNHFLFWQRIFPLKKKRKCFFSQKNTNVFFLKKHKHNRNKKFSKKEYRTLRNTAVTVTMDTRAICWYPSWCERQMYKWWRSKQRLENILIQPWCKLIHNWQSYVKAILIHVIIWRRSNSRGDSEMALIVIEYRRK